MKKVLILGDRLLAPGDLPKRLAAMGFTVVTGDSPSSDWSECVERASPDVVLMGESALRSIAAEEIPTLAPIPSVLLPEANEFKKTGAVKSGGCVLLPFDVGEISAALELAAGGLAEIGALKKENEELKKALEARKLIERAKGLLMKNRNLSEAEAFSLIQKRSMDLRKPMVDIAQAIVLSEEVTKS